MFLEKQVYFTRSKNYPIFNYPRRILKTNTLYSFFSFYISKKYIHVHNFPSSKKKERKKLIIVKDIKDKHTRRYTILFLFFRPCEIHNYTRSIKREIEIEKNLISLKDIKDKQARKFSRARQLSPPVITARFPYFQPRN